MATDLYRANRWSAWGDGEELEAERAWLASVGLDIDKVIVAWVEDRNRRSHFAGDYGWRIGYIPSNDVGDVKLDCEMNAVGCYDGHQCSIIAQETIDTHTPPPPHILAGLNPD